MLIKIYHILFIVVNPLYFYSSIAYNDYLLFVLNFIKALDLFLFIELLLKERFQAML